MRATRESGDWFICNFRVIGKSFREFFEIFDMIFGQFSIKLSDEFPGKK